LVLTFGTGIGAGIVADGALYRGASFAGEVGHMIMAPEGRRCACGQRGCWETLVSGSRLDRLAAELLAAAPDGTLARLVAGETPTGRHLVAAAEAGDAAARSVLAEAGRWLGRGVANLVAVLDPEVVVVGGAVAQAGDLLLEPARSQIPSVLEGSAHRPPVSLLPAALGPSAGAVGAALLALDQLTSPSEVP
jgi:glucokinase